VIFVRIVYRADSQQPFEIVIVLIIGNHSFVCNFQNLKYVESPKYGTTMDIFTSFFFKTVKLSKR